MMGIADRKIREREARRAAILEQAMQLIHEKGVNSFNMQDLADRLELSKATLYLSFKSKEELLSELMSDALDEFIRSVEPQISDSKTGIEGLRKLWLCYLENFSKENELFLAMGIQNTLAVGMPLHTAISGDGNSSMQKIVSLINNILQHGLADGTLDASIQPAQVTKMLILIATGIIQSVAQLPEELRDPNKITQEMKSIFEIILRGLASDRVDKTNLHL
ncbi:TetR/AcrR family transcriptional regulator [Treponema phagedenis]|uniref:TetR/AcrR family transcriptional regulator n=2 Tax=Treponema phagedenis TaxID=162 RepID=A0AAE6IV42_TREPH|nr:TetR/AcrR family transcriptional regulator [Treponema phagedenis]NVP24458.1 TetR/AcrR family transcriptional regulator [Treponema phagedenis]QEJ95477.1 TetR/AcrR family transcriptional regulator [Treponema phagedenis]QEJ97782.1 TetR/AcrR family transcriptional regulator [Treponema phagedenis]QEK01330.1 TetR/AcrR family transcriptional regulator [Treponema phagedenis]QEK03348.1 TetR/AcrR family transcriptional regulator [Treponema phagedenis]